MYGQDVVVSIADHTQMVHYCTVRRRTVNVVNTVCEKVLQLIYFFFVESIDITNANTSSLLFML